MKVNVTKKKRKCFEAEDVPPGTVCCLIDWDESLYAIRLDERDESGDVQFADFNGTIIYVGPAEKVAEVSFAEINIED